MPDRSSPANRKRVTSVAVKGRLGGFSLLRPLVAMKRPKVTCTCSESIDRMKTRQRTIDLTQKRFSSISSASVCAVVMDCEERFP